MGLAPMIGQRRFCHHCQELRIEGVRCCSSNRTPEPLCALLTGATCWRPARWCWRARDRSSWNTGKCSAPIWAKGRGRSGRPENRKGNYRYADLEPDKECMNAEQLQQLQLERLQATLIVFTGCGFLSALFQGHRVFTEVDLTDLRDLERFTIHDQQRHQRLLPLSDVCRTSPRSGSHSSSSGTNDQSPGGRLHAPGSQRLEPPRGAHPDGGGFSRDDVIRSPSPMALMTAVWGSITGGAHRRMVLPHFGRAVLTGRSRSCRITAPRSWFPPLPILW